MKRDWIVIMLYWPLPMLYWPMLANALLALALALLALALLRQVYSIIIEEHEEKMIKQFLKQLL